MLERGDDGTVIRVVPSGEARRLPDHAVNEWARATGATMIGPGCVVDAWPVARGIVRLWDAIRDADLESWEPDYGRLAEAEARRVALGAKAASPAAG